ncbi:TerC family protein [Desulfitobacterium sp.]|uniref:TerC family protein n=1 Tax=Desulfitobacterium sp. TaxID=49981 RepID=UPI002B1FAFD4|nr:TerC family protein [Desulfitobacterium sp.]MEA4901108.1 TerC family protein [Desulfitobacterium sp.]
MELFHPEFLNALLSIVLMDLVLGGDNAIVIGMAARNLPAKDQKKVIFLGTGGAILIRSLATLIAVWLLKIPGLMLIGGLFLVYMAYNLLVEEKSEENNIDASSSFWGAVRTIVVADAVMGLDNVLAVAGASHGSPLLVICGLLISIPIVVWGSTLVIKAINRFPIIIPIGAAVIAHTAATMITGESFVKNFIGENVFIEWGLSAVLIAGVLFLGYRRKKQSVDSNNQRKIA